MDMLRLKEGSSPPLWILRNAHVLQKSSFLTTDGYNFYIFVQTSQNKID